MERVLEDIVKEYNQTCVDLGENYYKMGVMERNVGNLIKKCDALQEEAKRALATEEAVKALAAKQAAEAAKVVAALKAVEGANGSGVQSN